MNKSPRPSVPLTGMLRSSATATSNSRGRPRACSKHDLQARPIYHRTRDSIEAHLTVVFAARIRTVGAPVSKVMTASAQHQPASSRAMAALATTARFLR
jgi:hypothetical protein